MKILTSTQIKDCDAATVEKGISSWALMEKAARMCTSWIADHFKSAQKFLIFCGTGNNGGDGFAIARMLYEKGFDVQVFMDLDQLTLSPDANVNFQKIKQISGIEINDFDKFSVIKNEQTVIIDAIFGNGLSRKLSEKVELVIDKINQSKAPKIAVDVPTGLYADRIADDNSLIVKADFTLTFQFYKRSFLHPETGKFCGKVELIDLGLDQDFISKTESKYFVIDESLIRSIYKPREDFTNKGAFGKSILVGGSHGKMGAVLMSVLSALRAGSGLTVALSPECGNFILQSQSPEAMFISSGEHHLENIEIQEKATYGIGPGLGKETVTQKALFDFLKNYNKPVVLDADALNMIAENDNISLIPKRSVITPHPLEFERLFGKTSNSFERLELAREKAHELQIFIVLKDHHTAVITPAKDVFYNVTGNSGMAKGGSGDVLTGILTALISQKYDIEKACIFGVWIHGKAGDFASETFSKEAMLPTDLIGKIGDVFKYLSS